MNRRDRMMDSILDLKGKTAMVTGAGQGVGRETAIYLAMSNAGTVVVNDFFLDRAEATAAEIEGIGVRAIPVQADVSDYTAVLEKFSEVENALGRLDILVNNAGNAGPTADVSTNMKPFWETDPDDWAVWLDVNLYGVMACTRAVLPGMIERRYGRIVTVISDAGRVGEPHLAAYSAGKGGAGAFTRAIAKAGGRYGVAANCVSLGAISTPGLEERLSDPERRKKVLGNYLIRRLGTPQDAAAAILYLASDAASWVTGQTIPVNGGYDFAV